MRSRVRKGLARGVGQGSGKMFDEARRDRRMDRQRETGRRVKAPPAATGGPLTTSAVGRVIRNHSAEYLAGAAGGRASGATSPR